MPFIHLRSNNKDLQIVKNYTKSQPSKYVDYKNKICVKPWGHEFLVYESNTIAIWYLRIIKGQSTSLHCHFEKDTNIIVLYGSAKIKLIDDEIFINTLSGVHIPKNKFHSISSYSSETYLLEFEHFGSTLFSDKNDLLRIDDPYKRDKTGYESSVSISTDLDKYNYFYLSEGFNDILHKVHITINSSVINSVYNIILKGTLYHNGKYYSEGSLLDNKICYVGDAQILSLDKIDYKEDDKIIYDIDQLRILKNMLISKNIVLTSGCFDILHIGHINILKQSKNLGDILIVCLSNDDQIKKLKGNNRPINNYADRIELFKSIPYVDYIVLYEESNIEKEETLDNIIRLLDPEYWTKGDDYILENILKKHPTIRNVKLFGNIENKSTSLIIDKIRKVL
jgi:rfaE bifunctional protein nucleotidyltransferase chain/domain